jgi:nucleoside-diphosphate-sugar epimerase
MGVKVFITGAGGYLGSVLATHLASMEDIDCITGIVHNTLPRTPLPSKVNLVKMDIRSPEIMDVMTGHDFVIHSASSSGGSQNVCDGCDDINFNGTRNVALAAIQNRVQGFIYASSIAAYDPIQTLGEKRTYMSNIPLEKAIR